MSYRNNNIFATRCFLQKYGDNKRRAHHINEDERRLESEVDSISSRESHLARKENKLEHRLHREKSKLRHLRRGSHELREDQSEERSVISNLRDNNSYLRHEFRDVERDNRYIASELSRAEDFVGEGYGDGLGYGGLGYADGLGYGEFGPYDRFNGPLGGPGRLDRFDRFDGGYDDESTCVRLIKKSDCLQERAAQLNALSEAKLEAAKHCAARKFGLAKCKLDEAKVTYDTAALALSDRSPGLRNGGDLSDQKAGNQLVYDITGGIGKNGCRRDPALFNGPASRLNECSEGLSNFNSNSSCGSNSNSSSSSNCNPVLSSLGNECSGGDGNILGAGNIKQTFIKAKVGECGETTCVPSGFSQNTNNNKDVSAEVNGLLEIQLNQKMMVLKAEEQALAQSTSIQQAREVARLQAQAGLLTVNSKINSALVTALNTCGTTGELVQSTLDSDLAKILNEQAQQTSSLTLAEGALVLGCAPATCNGGKGICPSGQTPCEIIGLNGQKIVTCCPTQPFSGCDLCGTGLDPSCTCPPGYYRDTIYDEKGNEIFLCCPTPTPTPTVTVFL